jgi:hypothetical protein
MTKGAASFPSLYSYNMAAGLQPLGAGPPAGKVGAVKTLAAAPARLPIAEIVSGTLVSVV